MSRTSSHTFVDFLFEEVRENSFDRSETGVKMYHTRVNESMLEKKAHYSISRKRVAALLERDAFEWCMGLVIVFNVAVLIMETDESGECTHSRGTRCDATFWLPWVNNALLCLYNVELFLRVFAYRWDIFSSKWNVLDIFVVATGHADLLVSIAIGSNNAVPSMVVLRVIRMVRLLRAVRILIAFKELYLLIHGFTSAMVAIFWGLLLMFAMLVIWSVLSVELIGPVNARLDHKSEYCDEAFSTVWRAVILYFQTLVAGDSWGACALPIVEESPLTFVLFIGVLSTVLIGLSNLVLAVIVERAAEAQAADVAHTMTERLNEEIESKKTLTGVCAAMDEDNNGTINIDELLCAYENNNVMQTEMVVMGIEKEELQAIFRVLDPERLGELPYDDFVDSLYSVKSKDTRVMMMLVRDELIQLNRRIDEFQQGVMRKLDAQAELLKSGACPRVDPSPLFVAPSSLAPPLEPPPLAASRAAELDRELQRCFEHLGQLMARGASLVEVSRGEAFPVGPPGGVAAAPQFFHESSSKLANFAQATRGGNLELVDRSPELVGVPPADLDDVPHPHSQSPSRGGTGKPVNRARPFSSSPILKAS